MFEYLRDKVATARLRARYERRVQERLMDLVEERTQRPVSEDAGDWLLVGEKSGRLGESARRELRDQARELVRDNPHARNILRLLEAYVVGDGLKLTVAAKRTSDEQVDDRWLMVLAELWDEFLMKNACHFSYREYARRVWRDGECFLRFFDDGEWPPAVRFVDPEQIGAGADDPHSQGVITDERDVERVRFYIQRNRDNSDVQQMIPADEVVHTRYGVDTNEKRGVSFFASIVQPLERFDQWSQTELLARKLQSSIVLWRKVQGGAGNAAAMADRARSGKSTGLDGDLRNERVLPGTILTTSAGTDIQFLQPDTNFGDAVPLGRMMLLCVAAGAGIPEFMLTADASNGNYASTLVAEGPAVKLFRSEQEFFTAAFGRLWRKVMESAVAAGLVPAEVLSQVELRWAYPELVSRDRPREREADVRLVEAGVLSRAEVQRREKLDPQQVAEELSREEPLRAQLAGQTTNGSGVNDVDA